MNRGVAIEDYEEECDIHDREQDKAKKWAEVMQLAEKYGFIRFAYARFAMLSIDEEAMEVG